MLAGQLILKKNEGAVLRLRPPKPVFSLGSDPSDDIMIPSDHPIASTRWSRLDGDRWQVERAPSADPEILAPGDTIALGAYRIEWQPATDTALRPERTRRLEDIGDVQGPLALEGPFGRVVLSAGDRIALGTDPSNDIPLDDPFASGFHCRVEVHGERLLVSDLGSTNGTRINGLVIESALLPLGAVLTVGQTELKAVLAQEAPPSDTPEFGIITQDEAMRRILRALPRLAQPMEPVLIHGESGSGKELIARALHDASPRADGPYLALNCGALSPSVIESELFGHERGAFTGAHERKLGAFEAAGGGTLFLDEVGELPLDLQPKLLRVLESSVIRRVGGTQEIPIETRIVAATHRDLRAQVAAGKFREDLYHRLFVLCVELPPLRDRAGDIALLARHFLSEAEPPRRLSAKAEAALAAHHWPGNVRELRNLLIRAILMSEGSEIRPEDLNLSPAPRAAAPRGEASAMPIVDPRQAPDADSEREALMRLLEQTRGNQAQAARLLGISKSTFHDRLRRYSVPSGYGRPQPR